MSILIASFLPSQRDEVVEARHLYVVAVAGVCVFDDLRQTDVALRPRHQPEFAWRGAERHFVDADVGIEQIVDQEIGAQVNAVAAVGLERDHARRQPVLHHDAGVEAEIGADIDEYIRPEFGAGAHEIPQFRIFADLGGNLQAADIDGTHQKVRAEIAADEIMAAMNEFVERAVEAAPQLIPPPQRKTHRSHSPSRADYSGKFALRTACLD